MKPEYLFLDLETTGLDPRECDIIELACILTDGQFNPIPGAEFQSLVRQPGPSARARDRWEHVAYLMHHQNGLLGEIRELEATGQATYYTLDYVTDQLVLFLAKHVGTGRVNLGGNSVHFDRSFLDWHMSRVLPFLTHRHLDVSAIRLFGMSAGHPKPEGPTAHRAMADVRASLGELDYWVRTLAPYATYGKKDT